MMSTNHQVLMTRLIGIALSKMSNHLDKHGTLRMRVTMYRTMYAKMMAQDMSYFEEKFKQKDQARVMIFDYCPGPPGRLSALSVFHSETVL